MILCCAVLAVASALLATGAAPGRRWGPRLVDPPERPHVVATAAPATRWRWWLGGASGLLGLVAVHRLAGAAAAAVSAAVLITFATCARLGGHHLGTRRGSRARVEVAHACSVLASQIRVGRIPAEALRSAADDCPVLAEASRAQELGGDVTAVWRAQARQPGHTGLLDLARAWQVSARTGAPLSESLDQVSVALAADVALRSVVAGELSAPRATGKIMAVLPFCGLGMGYLLGGDPVHFLLASGYGWTCLVLGVSLAAAGVLWIDRLSRVAAEQV
jgi:tight adherence protein B